jgi:hypothetical protein
MGLRQTRFAGEQRVQLSGDRKTGRRASDAVNPNQTEPHTLSHLLWWPNEHHRELRARLDAPSTADSSDDLDEDRHVMTTPAARSRKVVGSISRFLPSRAGAFSNIQIIDQFGQQSSVFITHRYSPVCELALFQAVPACGRPPAHSSAAFKSP